MHIVMKHRILHYFHQHQFIALIAATVIFLAGLSLTLTYAHHQLVDYPADGAPTASSFGAYRPLDAMKRYDSNHYEAITANGYTPATAAFFPLYPLLVKIVLSLGLSVGYALFVVSWLCTIAAAIVVFAWIRHELKIRKRALSPWSIILLIALFPTSFYLALGFSESLFILLTVSSLFAYRKGNYWLAGIVAALSTATRVQGIALMAFFLFDYLFVQRKHRNTRALTALFLAPLGIISYMIFLWVQFGSPLEFIAAQKYWGRLNGNPLSNLITSFTPLYLWFLPVLGAMLYAVKKKLGTIWLVYCLVAILIPISSGRLDSLNRYILSLPPLFLALALWLDSAPEWIRTAYYATSGFLLAWGVLLFANNYWVA